MADDLALGQIALRDPALLQSGRLMTELEWFAFAYTSPLDLNPQASRDAVAAPVINFSS
jgi:hypothetical protein